MNNLILFFKLKIEYSLSKNLIKNYISKNFASNYKKSLYYLFQK